MLNLLTAFLLSAPPATDDVFFEAKVRPVLIAKCCGCHGPEKVSGGLRLSGKCRRVWRTRFATRWE